MTIRLVVLGSELCRVEWDAPQPSTAQPTAQPPAGVFARGLDLMTDFFTRRFVRRRLL